MYKQNRREHNFHADVSSDTETWPTRSLWNVLWKNGAITVNHMKRKILMKVGLNLSSTKRGGAKRWTGWDMGTSRAHDRIVVQGGPEGPWEMVSEWGRKKRQTTNLVHQWWNPGQPAPHHGRLSRPSMHDASSWSNETSIQVFLLV